MNYIRTFSTARRTALALGFVAVASPHVAVRGQEPQLPFGWFAAVARPGEYVVRADVSRRTGGTGYVAATIASRVDEPRESAMMQQSIRADAYRGRRVRFTGYVKANVAVLGQAGLFLRVDGHDRTEISDFMIGRLIQTTTDWERYAIVLDVPADAVGITFGFHFTGTGQAWLDDASLETVGSDVATTVNLTPQLPFADQGDGASQPSPRVPLSQKYRRAPLQPVNLDFETLRSIVSRN
jgi:hypothetical protein